MSRGGKAPDLSALAVPELPVMPVPVMLDAAGLRTYFGVSASTAEFLMRQCPRRIESDAPRKVWVWTSDVLVFLRSREVAA